MVSEALPELAVSVVVFHPDLDLLRATLQSLAVSAGQAYSRGLLGRADLWLIDNGSDAPAALDAIVSESLAPYADWFAHHTIRGQGNVGYGSGHDLAISRSTAKWHLVLNPDVVLSPEAVGQGLRFLVSHPGISLLTPHAVDEHGQRQYLCKRYPSALVLALRGFAPASLRRSCRRILDRYEMRELPENQVTKGIPIASGCFMLANGEALRRVGGFSSRYFLYFEDFDLSLRLGRVAPIAYVPQVRIVHTGGEAARKGWAHRRMFIRSAFTFFWRNGWRLV
jgi:GT2 family glycosyltransferase